MEFFSVVIPTFNRAALIAQTIQSVVAQTFTGFEIIIIDDGSTDRTPEVVHEFIDNRIRYHRTENNERGAARNLGIKLSRGKYIVFLDSDDLMTPDHLSKLNSFLLNSDSINFLATRYFFFNSDGSRHGSDTGKMLPGFYSLDHFLGGNALACNLCIRNHNAALVWFVEDRRYSIMEDWIFIVQNVSNDKLFLVDQTTVLMRDHPLRSMRGNQEEVIKKRLLATEYIKKNVQLLPVQIRKLEGSTYYFCAIHSYLDSKRVDTFRYLIKAASKLGLKFSLLTLAVKGIIGKRTLERIRNAV